MSSAVVPSCGLQASGSFVAKMVAKVGYGEDIYIYMAISCKWVEEEEEEKEEEEEEAGIPQSC